MNAAPNVLALETSSERLSVALASGDARWNRSLEEGTRHSEHILIAIDALLSDAGLSLGALDAIAFGAGPGAFTGVRLGCGVAQGLALALGCPVVAVNSLQALAQGCSQPRGERSQSSVQRILTVIDARLGEVYVAGWEGVSGSWVARLEPTLAKPDALPIPTGTGWIGCGNAFAMHGDAIRARLGDLIANVPSLAPPDALGVLDIALAEFAAGRATTPELALPIYIRDKVALTVTERVARAASNKALPQGALSIGAPSK